MTTDETAAAAGVPADPTAPGPGAPYGRFANGKPRKAPKGSRARGSGGPSAPRASGQRRGAPRPPDYRPGLYGLAQMVCLPLAFAAPADAYAVQQHAPALIEALQALSVDRPEVAAMLDRLMTAGPYGALLAAAVPLLVQVAHNHDLLPEDMATKLGATPKRTILQGLAEQAQAAQAQAQQAAGEAAPQHDYAYAAV